MTQPWSSIPEAVAARAVDRPDAIAVSAADATLTYAELDARASRLANRLHDLGLGPDMVAAVVLPRSAAFVTATLGIVKSGAAYLPVDPTTPPDRLAFMLEDCGPRAVIVDSDTAARVPDGPWAEIDLREILGAADDATPRRYDVIKPEHLAYVIYTSGSTGRPKGVEVSHGSLANLIAWHCRAFTVVPRDRASFYASPAFDAAVWETWPYLASGASIHVPSDEIRLDAAALRDWLVARRISLAFAPTPVAELLLALAWPQTTALRALLTGADTLHRFPPPTLPFALVNNYGPTEATVVTTSGRVPTEPLADVLPSIGRPIDNVEVLILDEALHAVAPGAVGELCIGGAGLARGYRNRPDLTAERFVPHPGVPGARLYRTGDRARVLADGSIAFLGRLDEQVKIRGHRVELAEITAALGAHPGVAAAAVIAHDAGDGERRLVAYIAPTGQSLPGREALVSWLRRRLPDYMVPSTFVSVPALPLTANGKVDRAALPPPAPDNTLRDGEVTAPRTPVETELAGIIAALLGIAQVGVEDNFFLLGGHSLLGTQLIVRIRDAFGVDLGLRTLFDSPTVAELAAEIEARRLERAA